jgi:hypothetical protein
MLNKVIRRNLRKLTVKKKFAATALISAHLSAHQNDPIVNLMAQPGDNRQLWRQLLNELPTRFLV